MLLNWNFFFKTISFIYTTIWVKTIKSEKKKHYKQRVNIFSFDKSINEELRFLDKAKDVFFATLTLQVSKVFLVCMCVSL